MVATENKLAAMLRPLKVGRYELKNRFVMAPLTRTRADDNNVPTKMMVDYYASRASFGLIIAEATMVQKGYRSFAYEPGIYSKEHVEGWKQVTDAVHKKGGIIFLQIHHGGRSTVQSNLDDGLKVVSASPIAIEGRSSPPHFNRAGEKTTYPVPHELTVGEIKEVVGLFATAAKNAIEAGFDGVEIHGANTYLLEQFWCDSSNTRTDEYGGSIENRTRFMLEVVDAVCAAVGSDRVGLRISPVNSMNGTTDEDPEKATKYLCGELNKRNVAFVDVLRKDFFSPTEGADRWARESFKGVVFSGVGYDVAEAEAEVAKGGVDAVCFGRTAIANPDLVERAKVGAPLNEPDMAGFYGRTEEGYNTYPLLKADA